MFPDSSIVNIAEDVMFVFRKPDGSERLLFADPTYGNTNKAMVTFLGECIGKTAVRLVYQPPTGNYAEQEIARLEAAIAKELEKSRVAVEQMACRIKEIRNTQRGTA